MEPKEIYDQADFILKKLIVIETDLKRKPETYEIDKYNPQLSELYHKAKNLVNQLYKIKDKYPITDIQPPTLLLSTILKLHESIVDMERQIIIDRILGD